MSHKCQSILFAPGGRLLGEMASVSADLAHGHVIPEHSHPEDQLLFASSGVMTLHTKQGVWVVPPLRAVWIPADTPHSVAMSGPVSMRTLYFLPKLCRKLRGKCFVMNVSSLLRELILHACKFKRLNKRAVAERRTIEMIVPAAKDHSAEFIAETLGLPWIGSVTEAFGQFKKLLLLALFRLNAVLDELHQHTVGTQPAGLRQRANLSGDVRRKADALPYGLAWGAHGTS